MNANYLYDIFEATKKSGAPDLFIGLAMLAAEKPAPEGMNDAEVRQFLGRHYEGLTKAFATGDREFFADTVAACVKKDEE